VCVSCTHMTGSDMLTCQGALTAHQPPRASQTSSCLPVATTLTTSTRGTPTATCPPDKFMLAEGHTAENPMITRLSAPVDCDEVYWEYARDVAASVAADLIGPNVRFHHSKLNFKWPGCSRWAAHIACMHSVVVIILSPCTCFFIFLFLVRSDSVHSTDCILSNLQ
jgi:hypothetical protein